MRLVTDNFAFTVGANGRIFIKLWLLEICLRATACKHFPFGYSSIFWDDKELIDFAELNFHLEVTRWGTIELKIYKLEAHFVSYQGYIFPHGYTTVWWDDCKIIDIE